MVPMMTAQTIQGGAVEGESWERFMGWWIWISRGVSHPFFCSCSFSTAKTRIDLASQCFEVPRVFLSFSNFSCVGFGRGIVMRFSLMMVRIAVNPHPVNAFSAQIFLRTLCTMAE